jgi:hypothetical protein
MKIMIDPIFNELTDEKTWAVTTEIDGYEIQLGHITRGAECEMYDGYKYTSYDYGLYLDDGEARWAGLSVGDYTPTHETLASAKKEARRNVRVQQYREVELFA